MPSNLVAGQHQSTELTTTRKPIHPSILGNTLPWSHLVNASGQPATIEEFPHPLTLYLFSAAWCPPCNALAPSILALYSQYGHCDINFVYVGLEYTLEEHQDKSNTLPYWRFDWRNANLPENLPVDCENPFWLNNWTAIKSLRKMGIPTSIVVDTYAGTIIDRAVDLVLGDKNMSTTAMHVAVHSWKSGRSASTWWMRTRYWFVTHSYVQMYRFRRFLREWIMFPLRRLIQGPPLPQPELKTVTEDTSFSQTHHSVLPFDPSMNFSVGNNLRSRQTKVFPHSLALADDSINDETIKASAVAGSL